MHICKNCKYCRPFLGFGTYLAKCDDPENTRIDVVSGKPVRIIEFCVSVRAFEPSITKCAGYKDKRNAT